MDLSHRISDLTGGSNADAWALFFKTRALKDAGVALTDLTIGEHDIRTDPAILTAMHDAAMGGHTGYASLPGTPALRAAIAKRVAARTGVPTGPENVLVTAGGQAALFATHHAVLDEGTRALFPDPFYPTYPGTVRAVGGVPVPVPTRAEDGFVPRPESILAASDGNARSLLINTPNNPTGAVYDRTALEGIADAVREAGLWLISDEVYETMVWDGSHLTPRALPGMAERTLVVGSMSKTFAMTGSRIGWIVGPEAAIAAMGQLVIHTTYGVPGFVQDAALFALGLGDKFEDAIARPFRRRRDIAVACLARQNVVRAVPAAGAMYLMLDVRATGLSGVTVAEHLLDEERIAVLPGESFGGAAAGHLRLAMTVDDAAFETALTRLLEVVGAMAETRAAE
ncbi:MAG: aminotransferase class I/II-fold pyridoxal phosphate-dependent enzyme [Pseudomonadota bacterium]